MNKTRVVLLLAVGLAMGSTMMTASAADAAKAAPRNPVAPGVMGHPHMYGPHDGCGYESGMGHEMMGGMGMMESPRAGMVRALSLSDEQRAKINKLSDKLQHDNWAAMGAIMDESAKLRDLYEADRRDPAAIGKEYQKIFDMKRQMIEAMITTQNQIEDLLTDEQRAQLKDMRKKMGAMHGYSMMH
jgi:Spy/CpxP family protein refolding chaperone